MCENVAEEDAVTVSILKEAGAIILVKGNIPQILLSYNSQNRIWGLAMNPFDKSRTCGGSSGGDAALVSSRCVPMAIGTDLGGSVRIPSEFNGVFGFKPTPHRISNIGTKSLLP